MILALILATLLTSASGVNSTLVEPAAFKSVACDFLTHDNAMKILGRQSIGTDEGMTEDPEGRKWRCTFAPVDAAANSPKLHFMIMKSTSEDAAKQSFDGVRQSNKKHAGFEEWPGVSDEALVHSDGKNFQLVMVRKGVKSIRIKINPADGVSLDTVKAAAASLVPRM